MTQTDDIRDTALALGMDLCGFASVERFAGAPAGHHPADIYPACRTVIVFARRIPAESLFAPGRVPYTVVSQIALQEVDRLGVQLCLALEKTSIGAVLIPADDPYEDWDADRETGRGILSLRHAGMLAGLGTLGKNTLLINREFGNLIQLGAVLIDLALPQDPLADYEGCLPRCALCLTSCPSQALDGAGIDQKKCRGQSNMRNSRGFLLKNCHACRSICPRMFGIGREKLAVRKQRILSQRRPAGASEPS
jgi:epoxyqueuosine reductase QueG